MLRTTRVILLCIPSSYPRVCVCASDSNLHHFQRLSGLGIFDQPHDPNSSLGIAVHLERQRHRQRSPIVDGHAREFGARQDIPHCKRHTNDVVRVRDGAGRSVGRSVGLKVGRS